MIAVFSPLLTESDEILEREAAPCYNWIQESELPSDVRKTLTDVFVNWIEQRFSRKGKKEIEEMLLGQLPDLRETQTGKDLIAIGKVEGLITLLEIRFGKIPASLKNQLIQIQSPEQIDSLYEKALSSSMLADYASFL